LYDGEQLLVFLILVELVIGDAFQHFVFVLLGEILIFLFDFWLLFG
jgi:hypothetical protein